MATALNDGPQKRRWLRGAIVVGAVVLLAAAASVLGVAVLRQGGDKYPRQWDGRVAPIAAQVARLRGLQFKHAVKVDYLSARDFEAKVVASPDDLAKHRKEIDQATALLRAAGLLGANVDLASAANANEAAKTLAFYDPDKRQIYMRAGALTIASRVTLAHELTHVLQDQYFNLAELEKRATKSGNGSSDALDALIEGDADRIEHAYLRHQSAADRREYDRLTRADYAAASRRTKDVPEVVDLVFGAPYTFGPNVISILESDGGNRAIDAVLAAPAPSSRIYVDPASVRDSIPAPPAIPGLHAGEEKVTFADDDNTFDDFFFFMMLAARVDPSSALLAADAYSTGSMVTYRRDNVVCFRGAIDGGDPNSNRYLAAVLGRWTAAEPKAALESSAGPVIFHACDPGVDARRPDDARLKAASDLAETRAEVVAEFVKNGMERHEASCAARLLAQDPSSRDALLADTIATSTLEALRASARDAAAACRVDVHAGLPGAAYG